MTHLLVQVHLVQQLQQAAQNVCVFYQILGIVCDQIGYLSGVTWELVNRENKVLAEPTSLGSSVLQDTPLTAWNMSRSAQLMALRPS